MNNKYPFIYNGNHHPSLLKGLKKVKNKRVTYYTDGDIAVVMSTICVSFPLKQFIKQVIKPYGFIYIITSIIDGKVYVGKTTRYPPDRWKNHFSLKGNKYLANAIKKYGPDNFECLVVKKCYSEEKLANEELKQIVRYNSCDRSYGYNLKLQSSLFVKPSEIKIQDRRGEKNGMFNKGYLLPWFGKDRIDQSKFMTEDNPMKGKSVYSVWIEKYGKEQADLKKQDQINKLKNKIKSWTAEEKQEYNKKKACKGEKNGMYQKSVHSKWVEKYGLEIANKKWEDKKAKTKECFKQKLFNDPHIPDIKKMYFNNVSIKEMSIELKLSEGRIKKILLEVLNLPIENKK